MIFNIKKGLKTFDIEKGYEFTYDSENKYSIEKEVKVYVEEVKIKGKNQTIIYLPYYIKSSLTKTSYDDEQDENKLKERALDVLNSSLRKKYDAIKLRAYNSHKRYETFKEIIKDCNFTDEECKIAYSNGLNHKDEICGKSTQDIWDELEKKFKKENGLSDDKKFTFELSWKKFVEMMLSAKCEYCGISIKEIYCLAEKGSLFTKRARGYSMEIDQKDAFENYSDDNCTACCYWCNNRRFFNC
jgi:hypothetical protein